MGTRNPLRQLRPAPRFTRHLRVQLAIMADIIHQSETTATAALCNPLARKEARQLLNDLTSLVVVICDDQQPKEKTT